MTSIIRAGSNVSKALMPGGSVTMVEDYPEHPRQGRFLTSRAGVVMMGFLAIGFVLLFTEHRAHVLGALPWLFLLSCPLMHLFMHHGHGHHPQGAAAQPGADHASVEEQSQ
ncbi:DUF2933 domain-containing protein [Sphingomonas sp. RT2P30]|uniref:DUF2933 domain-containing protein n=1 Tax=Parasphingomonas halimpatiens TaxID=3096162 RepID=UPI003B580AC7